MKKVLVFLLAVSVMVNGFLTVTMKTQKETIDELTTAICEEYIEICSEEFRNNYVDMREVIDFIETEYGVQIILANGEGYYWER